MLSPVENPRDQSANNEAVTSALPVDESEPSVAAAKAERTELATAPDATSELEQLKEALNSARASEAQLVSEFANYRRHAEAALAEAKAKAQVELLAELADTVQALELASGAVDADPGSVREGVALVARNLKKLFDAHGLERIETEGVAFDPTLHEAVMAEQADGVDKGMIVREVSPGFRTEERVIRPAKVSVAA